MPLSVFRRVVFAAGVALPVAVAFAFLIETCGSIHGDPKCGPLSFVAVPFVVGALMLESTVFRSPQPEQVVRLLTWLIAYVVAFLFSLVAVWLLSLRNPD